MFQHIFISYASGDGRDFARRLHDDLEMAGFNTWLDIHDIRGGEDWNRAIDEALQSAWAVCVVLTPGAVASIQVQSEWSDALERHLPVIPLLVQNCTVPRVLKVFNWYDFREAYAQGVAGLRQRLQHLPNDHYHYLLQQQKLLPAQAAFEHKIAILQNAIERWTKHFKLTPPSMDNALQTSHPYSPPDAALSLVALRRQMAAGLNQQLFIGEDSE